jgi:hypothetical protein
MKRAPNDPRTLVYNSRAWRRTSRLVRERDGHECRDCHADANTAHHDPPLLELLALGLDPFDPDYCLTLCRTCHGRRDGARASKVKAQVKAQTNRFLTTVLSPAKAARAAR